MTPPRTTSSKKRRCKGQAEVAIERPCPDAVPVAVSQSQGTPSHITTSPLCTTASGPSIRSTVSSTDHISFGTQSTPTKRAKLDEVFSPLKKLFDYGNDESVDHSDPSYEASSESSNDRNIDNDEGDSDNNDASDSDDESIEDDSSSSTSNNTITADGAIHPNFVATMKKDSKRVSIAPGSYVTAIVLTIELDSTTRSEATPMPPTTKPTSPTHSTTSLSVVMSLSVRP